VPRAAPNKCKLTPLAVTKLRPQSRAFLVWDTMQRGLVLQVQPCGYRAFKIIYRYQNRPHWYHLGAADAIGLADARKLAAGIMLQVIQGVDPQAARKAQRGSDTFEELAARYCNEYAQKKNKSWRQAERLVARYLLPRWGKLKAADITRGDVKATVAQIKAPIVANQVLASASAIFSWAIREEQGGIHINPCTRVEGNPVQSRERVLADSEIASFWQAFGNAGLPGMALKVLLLTGQRPGEVRRLRREHIVDNEWWHLLGQPDPAVGWLGTKNKLSHRLPLSQPVRDIIAELGGDGTGFVFGQVWPLDAVMRDICRELKVSPPVRPHDLRRSYATVLMSLGHGRAAMDRLLNHADRSVGSVYDRFSYGAEDRRVTESVAAKLLVLAEGTAGPSNIRSLRRPGASV
jgi:integrase